MHCMYVILLTPRRVASFFERFSPLTHTTLLSVPFLSTVVNRFRFDSWGRSQLRLTWSQHWTNSYSRGSHALYLELRQQLTLPVRLRFRESNPRHAPSLLVTTLRRWLFSFEPTVVSGFRTTRSQENYFEKIDSCWPGFEPGPSDQQSDTPPTRPLCSSTNFLVFISLQIQIQIHS